MTKLVRFLKSTLWFWVFLAAYISLYIGIVFAINGNNPSHWINNFRLSDIYYEKYLLFGIISAFVLSFYSNRKRKYAVRIWLLSLILPYIFTVIVATLAYDKTESEVSNTKSYWGNFPDIEVNNINRDEAISKHWRDFRMNIFKSFILTLTFCLFIVWLIYISGPPKKPRPNPQKLDSWHPINNEPYKPESIRLATQPIPWKRNFKLELERIEEGLHDLHKQKDKMLKMKERWSSVPQISDKQFYKGEDHYGTGRTIAHSRYQIAGYIQTYLTYIERIEEWIVNINKYHGELLAKIPVAQGQTTQENLGGIPGLSFGAKLRVNPDFKDLDL